MTAPVYLDNKSVLVSTNKGLVRFTVPFSVIVFDDVGDLKVGDKLIVNLVSYSKKDKLLYYIRNRFYAYRFFVIIEQ